MGLPAKLVRSQLNFFKPFVANCSLETTRRGQDKLGELMEAIHRRDVIVRDHDFGPFQGAWIMPKDERRQGVVLYLHGGGYTCGNLDYAKGFAATLADECGVRVFCAAYRLAPEDRFPAALDDALVSYQYLLSKGYPAGVETEKSGSYLRLSGIFWSRASEVGSRCLYRVFCTAWARGFSIRSILSLESLPCREGILR